jgi:hypothetical protein
MRASGRGKPAASIPARDARRLSRLGLFHRLEGSPNLNSRDENDETGTLPDRFG